MSSSKNKEKSLSSKERKATIENTSSVKKKQSRGNTPSDTINSGTPKPSKGTKNSSKKVSTSKGEQTEQAEKVKTS